MKTLLLLLLCFLSHTLPSFSNSDTDVPLIPPRREVHGNGRIFDITHRITASMPSYDSPDGILGQFLWTPDRIKNGSLANGSVFKLPTHTGTHVDSPGHFFDHYLDAGFDIDTLDLEVLNGKSIIHCFHCCWLLLFHLFVSG